MRPPPETSEYHAQNPLYDGVDRPARRRGRRTTVVIPRTERQREGLPSGASRPRRPVLALVVPEQAIDAQSLIAFADLVVSAGGTMNREAVALGTPVYTIFSGEMGAVDERLIAEGRLRSSRSPDGSSWSSARRPPGPSSPRDPQLLVGRRAGVVPDLGESGRCAPSTPWDAVWAFVFAASVAWCWSRRRGDRPAHRRDRRAEERGLHDVPTPKLGGPGDPGRGAGAGAIWLPWDAETRAILAGAAAITRSGSSTTSSTCRRCRSSLGQIGAALIPVVLGDVRVDATTLPFVGGYELGWVSYPLTVIGIVAVINIINFIDGVDGLASGVCAISAGAFAVIAISLDRYEAGVLAAITAGASLGFLRHGFPPASSFMGDTGSNLLGYLLATVAVQGSLKTNAALALALPLLVLAVPILDTSFVVAKRLKYRQPIYQADRWHFHHRMANIGFSQRRTLLYLYGWTSSLAGLALALRFVPYSDDRGNFDPFWTVVMAGCCLRRWRRAST